MYSIERTNRRIGLRWTVEAFFKRWGNVEKRKKFRTKGEKVCE